MLHTPLTGICRRLHLGHAYFSHVPCMLLTVLLTVFLTVVGRLPQVRLDGSI